MFLKELLQTRKDTTCQKWADNFFPVGVCILNSTDSPKGIELAFYLSLFHPPDAL